MIRERGAEGVLARGKTSHQAATYSSLQLPLDKFPNLFHPPAVDAEVAVADPGGRSEMDGLGLIVEQKLDVVDESQQQAREFVVQIGLVLLDESCTGQGQDDSLQRFLRFCFAFLIAKRRNRMLLVLGLG